MTRRVASITMDENGIYIDDTLHVTGDMFIESNFNLLDIDANITAGFIEVSHTLTANTLVVTRIDEIDPGQGIEIIGNVILDESNYLFGNIGSLNLHILGNTYIHKALIVVGETTFCANVDVKGNKLSSNVIHVNDIHSNGSSEIAVHSTLSPAITGTYDLGSVTTKWKTLYVDLDVSVGNALLFDSVTSGIQIEGVASAVNAIAIGKSSSASANYSIAIGDLAHAYIADDIQLGRNVGSTGTGILRFHGQIVSDESWVGGGTKLALINSDGNIMKGGSFSMTGNLDMGDYSIINAESVRTEQIVVGNLSGNSLVTINDHAVSFSNAAVFETSGTEAMRLLDSSVGNFTYRTGVSTVSESPSTYFIPTAAQLVGGHISVAPSSDSGGVPVVEWSKQLATVNTTGSDTASRTAVDADGNMYVTYTTAGTVSGGTLLGSTDIVVIKVDSNGNLVWMKQSALFNTTGADTYPSIAVSSSGDVYVAYQSAGTVSGGTFIGAQDIVVFKLDTNGNHLWNQQQSAWNTTAQDFVPNIAVDDSGNVYVTFYVLSTVSGGTNIGSYDIIVFKLNSNGTHQWNHQSELTSTTNLDAVPEIAVDSSGNVYIVYNTNGTVSSGTYSGGVSDNVVFKLNTNGVHQWSRQLASFNTTGNDGGNDRDISIAVKKSTGDVYVSFASAGIVSGGTNIGSTDIVVFKLDTNGNHLWNNQAGTFNTTVAETRNSIGVDGSGNAYILYMSAGTVSGGTNLGSTDMVVIKLNSSGTHQWNIQSSAFNTTAADTLPSLAVTSAGVVYVTYSTPGTISGGTNLGSDDMVMFKINAPGTGVLAIGSDGGISGTTLSAYVQISNNVYVGLTFRCFVQITNTNLLAISGTSGTAANGITPYGDIAASNYPRELVFINTGTNTWDMLINGRVGADDTGYPPIGAAGGSLTGTYPNPTINATTALGFGGSSLIRSYEGTVGNGWSPTARFAQVITISTGILAFSRFVPIVDATVTVLYFMTGSGGLNAATGGIYTIFDASGNKLVEGVVGATTYGARALLGGTFTTASGYPSSIALTAGQKYWAGLLIRTGSGGVYGDTNVSVNLGWPATDIVNDYQIYCSSTGGGYTQFPASCAGIAFTQQDSGYSFVFK